MGKFKNVFIKDTNAFADFIASIAIIIISIVFLVSAQSLPTKAQGIGPGDYPTVICSMLLILGIILLTKTRL